MAAGKSKFSVLDKPTIGNAPASLSWKYITASTKCDDAEVTEHALDIIREHKPDVMFIHFPECDNVGHAVGWGTPEQLATVGRADECIGKIQDLMHEMKLDESTFTIVTSDHGARAEPTAPTTRAAEPSPGSRPARACARISTSRA